MIEKKLLYDGNGEFARTDRVHLCVLSDDDKDTYLSNKFRGDYKDNKYIEIYLNAMWEVANSEHILTFCIWDNETDEYMGYCNYNELDADIPCIGIELVETAQNQGLGYEVCTLLLANYFDKTDLPAIRYEATRSNALSRNLGEKLGGVLKDIKVLLPSLVEMNESLPEKKRIDISELDVFSYMISRER